MNLFEVLKQFKAIQPDRTYSETSKRAMFAMTPKAAPSWSVRRTFFRIIETGAAVALAGFFVLLLTGGFTNYNLTPVKYSAIDPKGLRAEAQAIDIQIQLANVNYSAIEAASTPAIIKPKKSATTIKTSPVIPQTAAESTQATSSTNPASTTITINQALEGLSN